MGVLADDVCAHVCDGEAGAAVVGSLDVDVDMCVTVLSFWFNHCAKWNVTQLQVPLL